uniref:Uncharacterized protein n=1 Tax=Rhizophora mucronata TaxID=61149 RepID=A0A2P2QBT2_RHIMU
MCQLKWEGASTYAIYLPFRKAKHVALKDITHGRAKVRLNNNASYLAGEKVDS